MLNHPGNLAPLHAFARAMPKIELHVHLEGALLPATVLKLAQRHQLPLPARTETELQDWYQFRDFRHFIEVYLKLQNLLRSSADFELITYDFGREMQRQNIRYAEVTFTAYTHLWMNKGLSPDDIITGLDAGRCRAQEDLGVTIAWVLDIPRNLSFEGQRYTGAASDPTVEMALAWQDRGVVALGLGGDERTAAAEPFAPAFTEARAGGLHSVPHAGEMDGPGSVWGSLRALGAERIGHGVRAIEDPTLIDYLITHHIPLEVNPTSNICLGVYDSYAAHPLRQLWDAGVLVTVNSDDPLLFNTTLNQEYDLLIDHFGFGAAELEQISLNALHASFLPPERKAELEQSFRQEFAQLHSLYE